jgi:hypothetical protein
MLIAEGGKVGQGLDILLLHEAIFRGADEGIRPWAEKSTKAKLMNSVV